MKAKTYGEAVSDPATRLGAMAAQVAAARAERLAQARQIAERESITLADAVAKVWA